MLVAMNQHTGVMPQRIAHLLTTAMHKHDTGIEARVVDVSDEVGCCEIGLFRQNQRRPWFIVLNEEGYGYTSHPKTTPSRWDTPADLIDFITEIVASGHD